MFTRNNKLSTAAMILMVAGMVVSFSSLILAENKPVGDAYPLDYCLVTGEKLGSMGDPVKYDHNGREIKLCCAGCTGEFKKNADKYIGQLDSIIIEQQLPFYPLETCVVSGEKFGGEMGEPVNTVHNNRLVRFCCNMCTKTFAKDPAVYISKLDSAVVAAQKDAYPLQTCVISGGKLGSMGDPVDYVYGNRLVRFCCGGCVDGFNANPMAGLAKIDAALAPKKDVKQPKVEKKDKSG